MALVAETKRDREKLNLIRRFCSAAGQIRSMIRFVCCFRRDESQTESSRVPTLRLCAPPAKRIPVSDDRSQPMAASGSFVRGPSLPATRFCWPGSLERDRLS